MVNKVSLEHYRRFCSEMSRVNMDMTRVSVAAIKMADEKKSGSAKETALEKTVSHERE